MVDGEIREDRGQAPPLRTWSIFPMRRYPQLPLLPRIWELRHNLTAYDAAYVLLAEASMRRG